jgi:hypothetical protein
VKREATANPQVTLHQSPIVWNPRSRFDLNENSVTFVTLATGDPNRSPTALRLWLGDERLRSITVFPWTLSSEVNEIISLFPEAAVTAEDGESGRRGTGSENADVTGPATSP